VDAFKSYHYPIGAEVLVLTYLDVAHFCINKRKGICSSRKFVQYVLQARKRISLLFSVYTMEKMM
jgi:hypothetical protein